MVFDAFKSSVARLVEITPNAFLPKLGEKLSKGKIDRNGWAELYLLIRFMFSAQLATVMPKAKCLILIVAFIQTSSLLYLLKIVFPCGERKLKDPSRSLFFALGHYLEIGLSMGYIYWCAGEFGEHTLTRIQSVYFSFVTMTTVGFGDIVPTSDGTRLMVSAQAVVGVFMLATVIGLFLSMSSGDRQPGN